MKQKKYSKDATSILEDIRSGITTSEEVVKAHLNQLKQVNPDTNAAIKIYEEEAIELAKKLDLSGNKNLPLFGLPYSIKETFGIKGEEITAGSIRRKPDAIVEDSEMVKRMREAGAVVIARSNLPEFAMTGESTNLRFGKCNNPHDITRTAGGSTGGEGALVGSASSVFGLGSDILGSIRIPAAFCGTVGFKAHSKAINSAGTWPEINTSLKNWLGYGPICRSVRDAQLIYNVIANEPSAVTNNVFKNVLITEGFSPKFKQECIKMALDSAREAVINNGLTIKKADFSEIPKLFSLIPKIVINEFYDGWKKDLSSLPEYGEFSTFKEVINQLIGKPTIDHGLLKLMLIKPLMKSRTLDKQLEIENTFINARAHYRQLIGNDSVIISPTLGMVAPKHFSLNRASLNPFDEGCFTSHTLGNYFDLSAIAIPAWKFCDKQTGLPASISLMCTPGNEDLLFSTALIVEKALN